MFQSAKSGAQSKTHSRNVKLMGFPAWMRRRHCMRSMVALGLGGLKIHFGIGFLHGRKVSRPEFSFILLKDEVGKFCLSFLREHAKESLNAENGYHYWPKCWQMRRVCTVS